MGESLPFDIKKQFLIMYLLVSMSARGMSETVKGLCIHSKLIYLDGPESCRSIIMRGQSYIVNEKKERLISREKPDKMNGIQLLD